MGEISELFARRLSGMLILSALFVEHRILLMRANFAIKLKNRRNVVVLG